MAATIGLMQPGVRVLELGAGVGWLGMCLSHNLPLAKAVLCTEQRGGGALQWLRHNIEQNTHLSLQNLCTCHCDWADFGDDQAAGECARSALLGSQPLCSDAEAEGPRCEDGANVRWDFVVGSDLVYTEDGARQLPRVMRAMATQRTHIYYAHTKRRFEHLDQVFFAELERCGLAWEEVREPWAPVRPPSPPPFESLFPDMRIAVLHIQRCSP